MTKQPRIKAEVDYDHQHGPLVRVTVDGVDVAVYLADETGIVTKPNGQYGLKVSGPWHEFRQGVKLVALDATVDDVET